MRIAIKNCYIVAMKTLMSCEKTNHPTAEEDTAKSEESVKKVGQRALIYKRRPIKPKAKKDDSRSIEKEKKQLRRWKKRWRKIITKTAYEEATSTSRNSPVKNARN